jgi:hypothetical protein
MICLDGKSIFEKEDLMNFFYDSNAVRFLKILIVLKVAR